MWVERAEEADDDADQLGPKAAAAINIVALMQIAST